MTRRRTKSGFAYGVIREGTVTVIVLNPPKVVTSEGAA